MAQDADSSGDEMNSYQDLSFETKAIHAGQEFEKWSHSEVVPPIVTTMTFAQEDPTIISLLSTAHTYGRFGNPTRSTLEKCIAALDNTNYALTFTSGCAAIHALLHLLKSGDHIVSSNEQFGPDAVLEDFCKATGVEVDFVDSTVLKQIEDAIKPNTKMIWIMTPSNPRLRYSDVASIAKIAHSHPNIILAVDNTFLTPYFLRALDLGADIVMYSLTKYLNGHNDVMGGALTFLSEELYKKVKYYQAAFGIALSPFDCYLTNRGLKTLALRMQKHSDNGIAIARYLQSHPMVSKVMHPVLPSHPDHELAMTQCSGYSSIVSFEIKGTLKEAKKFVQSLQIIQSCGSLGSYASFAMLPIAQLFSGKEAWYKLGVHENLIRFSAGLENADDLIKDMEQSFDKTYQ
ncbi:cystathionine gamma-lyase-like [Bradysia coprophila]|uniref:cystathionine gamma-lyase-like n=1 Tax=Bradysia coprophila TaxID=38358 RepID=UPI00187D8744|nr:cystathionine gamma-lyase-like [Bradysia coprophila]XP_037048146.1 cystathionine gamma-lyase-like [Bradysia coprophila]